MTNSNNFGILFLYPKPVRKILHEPEACARVNVLCAFLWAE